MTDIRPGIVSLLVDTRNLGGPTSKIKHLDGSPLTQGEVSLVCSATWDELIAAWGMKELDASFDPDYPLAADEQEKCPRCGMLLDPDGTCSNLYWRGKQLRPCTKEN